MKPDFTLLSEKKIWEAISSSQHNFHLINS